MSTAPHDYTHAELDLQIATLLEPDPQPDGMGNASDGTYTSYAGCWEGPRVSHTEYAWTPVRFAIDVTRVLSWISRLWPDSFVTFHPATNPEDTAQGTRVCIVGSSVSAAIHGRGVGATDALAASHVLLAGLTGPDGATVRARLHGVDQRPLLEKFKVVRTDGSSAPGGKHEGCRYFVLDIACDPYARPALGAYAAACAERHPVLAQSLQAWLAGGVYKPALEIR